MNDYYSHRPSRRDLLKLTGAVAGTAALPLTAYNVAYSWFSHTESPGSAADRDIANENQLPSRIPTGRCARPNVLLIVLDTVRADHLSCYGYPRETAPNLSAFAASARKYENVMATGSYTLPTHASLFTGLPATAHGAGFSHQYLDQQSPALAELLQAAGYQTAAWSCNGYWAGPRNGMDRGFQSFQVPENAADMHQGLGDWLTNQHNPTQPFFVFLNYMEAHRPYTMLPKNSWRWTSDKAWLNQTVGDPNRHYLAAMEQMVRRTPLVPPEEVAEAEGLYDEALAYLDTKLGQLFQCLDGNGLLDNTLVVVTSDHGEQFNDHYSWFHGFSLYEPVLRVPLLLRYPQRVPAGEEPRLVQGHDIFPTILEIAGVEWERKPAHNCQSLLWIDPEPRLAVAEHLEPYYDQIAELAKACPQLDCSKAFRSLRAVRRENFKLILSSTEAPELYDLGQDPQESRNLASQQPSVVQDLSGRLETWLQSFPHYQYVAEAHSNVRAQTTEKEFQAGRGLGYIH